MINTTGVLYILFSEAKSFRLASFVKNGSALKPELGHQNLPCSAACWQTSGTCLYSFACKEQHQSLRMFGCFTLSLPSLCHTFLSDLMIHV